MTKREKLRKKLRNSPANSTMQEVQTLLQQFGFELARVRGSHAIFEYDDGEQFAQIVVPHHGQKVKRVYIQNVIESLDNLFPVEDKAGNDDD